MLFKARLHLFVTIFYTMITEYKYFIQYQNLFVCMIRYGSKKGKKNCYIYRFIHTDFPTTCIYRDNFCITLNTMAKVRKLTNSRVVIECYCGCTSRHNFEQKLKLCQLGIERISRQVILYLSHGLESIQIQNIQTSQFE